MVRRGKDFLLNNATNDRRLRVAHVLPGLRTGGAERVLAEIVRNTPDIDHFVVSLGGMDDIGQELLDIGADVSALQSRILTSSYDLLRLRRRLARFQPDLIHGWLYIGALAAMLGGAGSRAAKIAAFHATSLKLEDLRVRNRLIMDAVRLCCDRFRGVVYCSGSASSFHRSRGFRNASERIILNGVDAAAFVPVGDRRREARAALGLGEDEIVVGCPARFDPQKDHAGLLQAFAAVATDDRRLHLSLCGFDIDHDNTDLVALIDAQGLAGRVSLHGVRTDMPLVYAAFDAMVLPSAYGEALPLTVLEAMACEVPVVATRVGDTGALVEGVGVVVPPNDPAALAAGLREVVSWTPSVRRERVSLGRRRVSEFYSAKAMAERYSEFYWKLAAAG
jgi:glycosyltransferase involved in cell wall biosynthesis